MGEFYALNEMIERLISYFALFLMMSTLMNTKKKNTLRNNINLKAKLCDPKCCHLKWLE